MDKEAKQPQINTPQRSSSEPKPLPIDPIPFNLFKHGGLYKRQSSIECYPDDTRYVLFMLDTSGSIGLQNFTRMTSSLSMLVNHFCRHIQVAAFTFSGQHFIEFCFDCFDNDCIGRDQARDAMTCIQYRGGGTHTGEATQCVCDNVLTPRCGFPELSTDRITCLDVVYVTDGKSKGPTNVCDKVQCLYDLEHQGVELNVFAIGIDDYNMTELQCITKSHSFNYVNNPILEADSFDDFENTISIIGQQFDQLNSALPDCFAIDDNGGFGFDDCSLSG